MINEEARPQAGRRPRTSPSRASPGRRGEARCVSNKVPAAPSGILGTQPRAVGGWMTATRRHMRRARFDQTARHRLSQFFCRRPIARSSSTAALRAGNDARLASSSSRRASSSAQVCPAWLIIIWSDRFGSVASARRNPAGDTCFRLANMAAPVGTERSTTPAPVSAGTATRLISSSSVSMKRWPPLGFCGSIGIAPLHIEANRHAAKNASLGERARLVRDRRDASRCELDTRSKLTGNDTDRGRNTDRRHRSARSAPRRP
jgi:hypothetical protein